MKKKSESPAPSSATSGSTVAGRERRQSVQSAQTCLVVLKGLARLGGRATLTGLAAYVDESPAKVHRYLVSLIDEGLVVQNSGSQQYQLGSEAMLIGVAAVRQVDPVREAEPALVRLRENLELTSFVAVMGNKGPTIIRFEEPGLPVTVNVRVGSVMSLLWSATGRVFLGMLEDSAMLALARDELKQADPELRAQLDVKDPIGKLRRSIHETGYAAVQDTNLKGISAVSAPIFDQTGRLCAALTALGATGGFDATPGGAVTAAIRSEAAKVSGMLGYVAAGS